MTNPDDRRTAVRVPLDVVVNCGKSAFAQAVDVSVGGLCLIAEDEAKTGAMLHLSFSIPGHGQAIVGFGKVAWCRPAGESHFKIGVEFWGFEDAAAEAIRQYCKRVVSA